MLRAPRRGVDTDDWTWIADARRPAAVPPAERRRLGRDALARHLDASAAAGPRPAQIDRRRRDRRRRPLRRAGGAGGRRCARRSRFWGNPTLSRRRARELRALRGARRDVATDDWQQAAYRGAAPERAADADRHLPRLADLLSAPRPHRCCDEFTALAARCARGVAEAGRGLPSIEPGMPVPGGNRAQPALVPAALGAALRSVYGGLASCGSALRGGHRPGGRRAATRCSSRSSSRAASTRSRCSRRSNDATYRRLRPKLALRRAPAPRSTEDPRLRWHPRRRRSHDLHREGKVTVLPGGRLHGRRPVPLHLAPLLGGRRARRPTRHRLDGPAARPRRHRRQPAAGALARRLALAGARHRAGAGRGDRRAELRPLGARASGASVEDADVRERSASSARRRRRKDAALRAAGAVAARRCSCARSSQPFSARRSTRPVAYPDDGDFAESLAALAAMLAAGLPIRCAALARPGAYDTHDNQTEELRRA